MSKNKTKQDLLLRQAGERAPHYSIFTRVLKQLMLPVALISDLVCYITVSHNTFNEGLASYLPIALVGTAALDIPMSMAGELACRQLPQKASRRRWIQVAGLVAVFLVVRKDFGLAAEKESAISPRRRLIVSLLIGVFIGGYDGLVGPGTGTFMIMAFTAFLSMDMISASGCAKAGNLASNVAAAVVFLLNGKVMWSVVVPAAVCNALGGWCGARYAIRGGSRRVRGMIFVVLGLLFVKMLWELAPGAL